MSRARSDLVKVLQAHGCERAHQAALICLGSDGAEVQRLSFLDLDRRARAFAASLRARTAPGAHVLLPAPSTAETAVALVGCLYAGRPCALTPAPGRGGDLRRLEAAAAASRAQAVVTVRGGDLPPSRLAELIRLPHPPSADADADADAGLDEDAPAPFGDDVALLQFTSGSTRAPRAVRLTHANVAADLGMLRAALEVGPQSRFASWLPLFHDMGLAMLLMPLVFGATGVLLPPLAFVRRPSRWLRMVHDHRATITGAPNFAFDLCLERIADEDLDGLDLSCCDIAFCGAEPVRHSTMVGFAQRLACRGLRAGALFPCYGLAEAVCFVAGGRLFPKGVAEGCEGSTPCGRAAPGLDLRIVEPSTLRPLAPGMTGEVWIAGASVGSGYLDAGDADDAADPFDAVTADGVGGFLRTGDLGALDEQGRLHIVGRLKDVVIHRGVNIPAVDLELEVVGSHPGFGGAGAAFSVPQTDGDVIVIVQEVARGPAPADADVLSEAARRAVTAGFGVAPDDVVVVRAGSLPKTTSGKVRRAAVRELYLAGDLTVIRPGGSASASARTWP